MQEYKGTKMSNNNNIENSAEDHISSHLGIGSVYIQNDDHIIRDEHIDQAIENSLTLPSSFKRLYIQYVETFYMIDGKYYSEKPLNKIASKLEAHSSILLSEKKEK